MNDLRLTGHAVMRMAQRAILFSDLDLILAFGSEVEGGLLVRKKDVKDAEIAIRDVLRRLQKMSGKRIVISDGEIVTAYHATKSDQHRLMRRGH